MGSKKKKQESESSSSSSESESESSDSSTEKRSKHKNKKQASGDKKRAEKGDEVDKEPKHNKRKRSPSPSRKVREDKRPKEDRSRHDDRKHTRSYDDRDRYRGRRPDYRNNSNRRDRRDYRGRREDNRNYGRDRNNRENHQRRRSRSASFDHANAKWGKDDEKKSQDSKEKQKPNFGLSGKLTEETNTYRGVVIKYSEPPEARKPKRRWRLYPFKGERALQTLYIHRESAYLIGRDRKVVDLPVDHPSCSKQHAALQYRLVPFTRDDGTVGKRVRPYIIDLNSANGTYINQKRIEASKYVELLEKDVIKFGYSSREYVLLHENSKDEAQDDDVKQEEEVVVVKSEAN